MTTQHTVTGQQWGDLPVPALGELEPTLRVCVVIPARDCQEDLDRTLAALGRQTYPAELTEVVVVDDASPLPLTVHGLAPAGTRVLRVEEAQEHGSGRARERGARSTDADVIVFLDADMVVSAAHLESHARWHHVTPHAVVLGRKWFVDFDGITPDDVARAVSGDALGELLEGRERKRHGWQEAFVKERRYLTQDVADSFVAVVGADVSVRRDLYLRTGGFAPLGLRGIVDTEFGYRALTSGGVIIPDWKTTAYHQGARNFVSRGDEIKRERTGLAANLLPIPLFRPQNTGRQWTVPGVHVVVETDGAAPEDVQVTTDSLLASGHTDLTVTLPGSATLPRWLHDYFAADARVSFTEAAPGSGYPSPVTARVTAGLVLDRETVGRALEKITEGGGVRAEVAPGRHLTVETTRSVLRRAHATGEGTVPEPEAVSPESLGVRAAVFHVTAQGMIALGEKPAPTLKASPATRPVPARARLRRLLGRVRRKLTARR
ncbi:glycosyltransferase [Georgenia satyanarayanai]|uniref:glycosyltransferase n=1 Tax=Georgenia satyanarayanai TaxID=860221 RepID=UPI001264B100|nr:glycosyltransferase family 2 protein [Georgenia satyanarayanai]